MREKHKTGTAKEKQLARSAAFAAVMALRHTGTGEQPQTGSGVSYASPVRRMRTARTGTWTRRGR